MLFEERPEGRLTSLEPLIPAWPDNLANNDIGLNIVIVGLELIIEGPLWNLIDLEAILAILQNLHLKVSAVLDGCLLGHIDIRSSVLDLSRGDHSELIAEVVVGHEEGTVVGIGVEVYALSLLGRHVVPVRVRIRPGGFGLGLAPWVTQFDQPVDVAVGVQLDCAEQSVRMA
jgi:hypothetical protein